MAASGKHDSYRPKDRKKGGNKRTRLKPIDKKPAPKAGFTPAAPGKKPPPPAPVKPTAVNPFKSGQDLTDFNDFVTNLATQLSQIDFSLSDLTTDTNYQKGQTNKQAVEQTSTAQDAMAARGLFRSSIKDAALYDIEAQRALNTKFLDDKLTAATLNAGTQKKILADSKKRFDESMNVRMAENASAINDPAAATWAEQMAEWQQKYGKPAAPKPGGAATAPSPSGGKGKGGTHGANTNKGSGNANHGQKRLKLRPLKSPLQTNKKPVLGPR